MVFPIRAHIDSIKRLMVGDCYTGRGSRHRGLTKSIFCTTHKVSTVGRDREQSTCSTRTCRQTKPYWISCGHYRVCLACHCTPNQACHGEILIRRFSEQYMDAFDRSSTSVTPDSAVLDYLAMIGEEP